MNEIKYYTCPSKFSSRLAFLSNRVLHISVLLVNGYSKDLVHECSRLFKMVMLQNFSIKAFDVYAKAMVLIYLTFLYGERLSSLTTCAICLCVRVAKKIFGIL